jgi:hypothetical protein
MKDLTKLERLEVYKQEIEKAQIKQKELISKIPQAYHEFVLSILDTQNDIRFYRNRIVELENSID